MAGFEQGSNARAGMLMRAERVGAAAVCWALVGDPHGVRITGLWRVL